MAYETQAAVVVECDRCGARSRLLDPEQVGGWQQRHDAEHEAEDRRKRWAEQGHRVRAVTDWMVEDDSSGHAECSCGWRSRQAKACWAQDKADRHLVEVEQAAVFRDLQTPDRSSGAVRTSKQAVSGREAGTGASDG